MNYTSDVSELEAYRRLGKLMTPEQYSKVAQKTIKAKDTWVHRPIGDVNIVIATAFKNRKGAK